LVPSSKGTGDEEYSAEENMWAYQGQGNRELEENASWFVMMCVIKCRLIWVGHAAHMGGQGRC